jgi:uncharacterized protein (DUF1499 family)
MKANVQKESRAYSAIAVSGFIIALVAGGAEILAGFGTQWGLWDYRKGFLILRWTAYSSVAIGIISLAGCFLARPKGSHRGLFLSVAGLLIALVVFSIPWSLQQKARHVPAIHDITTDMENPPSFVALLSERKTAVNKPEYGGAEIAAKQRAAYPEIVPLEISRPASETFKLALTAARDIGWKIVDANEREGRIEATDTTFWFGFKDDVVIRITPTTQGSRLDVRSASRVGRSDLGTNARRITKYLKAIRQVG